eukprot:476902-Rhodomonas_salina.3
MQTLLTDMRDIIEISGCPGGLVVSSEVDRVRAAAQVTPKDPRNPTPGPTAVLSRLPTPQPVVNSVDPTKESRAHSSRHGSSEQVGAEPEDPGRGWHAEQ